MAPILQTLAAWTNNQNAMYQANAYPNLIHKLLNGNMFMHYESPNLVNDIVISLKAYQSMFSMSLYRYSAILKARETLVNLCDDHGIVCRKIVESCE